MAAKFKIESGAQLLARLTRKPNIEHFYPKLFQSGPKSGDIIEIFSDCCVSHLLVDIISEALMQTKPDGVTIGVLVFNTDGILNYDDLVEVIKEKILLTVQETNDTQAEDVLNKMLNDILTNLYLVNIYDATQYYTTINNLESTLIEHNISLIIFHTLTAFYWSEQGYKITKMDLYTKNLINMILKITREYKTTCMYTRPGYFCTNKDIETLPTELNYQIQVLENGKNNYQVNIKTLSVKTTHFYKIINGYIKWM